MTNPSSQIERIGHHQRKRNFLEAKKFCEKKNRRNFRIWWLALLVESEENAVVR
jgi:hypothetical protein